MTVTLSSPSAMAPALQAVAAALSQASGLPTSTFTISAPASQQLLANAPFSIAEPSVATEPATAGSGNIGGAVGGAIVGIIVLSCAIWAYRS
jgi:hypothetical protein